MSKLSSSRAGWSTLDFNPFENEIWLAYAQGEVEKGLKRSVDTNERNPPYIEPVISLLRERESLLSVLDFGGGVGQVLPYIYNKKNTYTVLDGPRNCQIGRNLFHGFSNINFCDTVPKDGSCYDLVLFNGSLHYIEDWRSALKIVSSFNPMWICIARLAVGSPVTVIGTQIIEIGESSQYVGEILRWIISFDELRETLAALNYTCVAVHSIKKTFPRGIADDAVPKELDLQTLIFKADQHQGLLSCVKKVARN